MRKTSRLLRKRKRRRKKRITIPRFKQNMVSLILKLSLIGVIGFFLLGLFLFVWYSRNLPSPGEIRRSSGFSTVFLDRNDKVLYEMFEDKNRIPVEIEDVPDHLKQATIAIEDKNFYKHSGFSTWGIIRSMLTIVTTGRLAGGSTLTQQLVKNVLLTTERTFTRKIKEVILATEIERRFTKDEILEMYLNESPYGGTYWGVQSASKGYYDKEVEDLTLVESAVLAGLPQRPSVYSPLIGTQDAYKGRTADVLRRMREDGYITEEEEEQAVEDLETLVFEGNAVGINAPHFVFYVRKIIAEQFGEKIIDEGIKIKTTLDIEAQEAAQDITYEKIEEIKSLNATNGSVVVLDSETGHILAMVGSYDYNDDKFGRYNVATALRQPGSAVKPFTYATAFSQGYTPASLIMDVQTEFPDQGGKTYKPVNYDGKYRGPTQYRFSLANSLNVSAVKILAQVGIRNMLQTAYDMGLKTFEPTDENIKRFGLSITLGGGETTLMDITNGFSTFARGGEYVEPTAILEIRDHNDKVIFEADENKPERVISEEVAYLISHILSDNNARADAFGTNSFLNIPGNTVAVKTGTTNDKRDNWTIGYTNDVTVGVWVGNNDNSPMNEQIASGLTGASPIWQKIMIELLNLGYEQGIPEKPEDVVALQIDSLVGGLPKGDSPLRSEYFMKGSEPTEVSSYYKKVKISKNETDKLANDVEIKSGEYEEKDYIVIVENDPVSSDGKNRWQEAINAWAAGQGDERFKVPTSKSGAKGDEVVVSFREPKDKSKINKNDIRVKARIVSLHSIKKVEIFIDGDNKKTYKGNVKEIDETFDFEDGTHTIKIRAENSKGKTKENRVRIGVNVEWDYEEPEPEPTAGPTNAPPAEPVPETTS